MRIFADLVVMTDAVRLAIHLQRRIDDPLFFKIVSDGKKSTHVAKLQTEAAFDRLKPYLKEAYESSLAPPLVPRVLADRESPSRRR